MKSFSISFASKSSPRRLGVFAAGVVAGAAGCGIGLLLAESAPGGLNLIAKVLRWSDLLALFVGWGLVTGAVFAFITSLNARRLGRLYNLESDATAEEMAQARFQSLVYGFSGVIVALPVGLSLAGFDPVLGLAAIGLLLVLHTVMNVRVYRMADELLRRAVLETAAATFFAGQLILFVWAVAERLAVAPPITAWDIYAVLMTLYLAVSIWINVRRGLA